MNTKFPANHAASGDTAATQRLKLRDVSIKLEATFLAEMLKSAGLGRTPDVLGGGVGESQYQSFLLDAQSLAMAESGGIGLADQIFADLLRRSTND